MEEEIKRSLQDFVDGGTVDYSHSPTDKIDNPSSVSAFFLRNINKKPITCPQHTSPVNTLGCSKQPELPANAAILKWWKEEGRDFSRLGVIDPSSENVHTVANCIARSEQGAELLRREVKRLRDKITSGQNSHDVYAAISSFYEKLENRTVARMHLETAIDKSPGDKRYKWLMTRLEFCLRVQEDQEEALKRINFNSVSQLSPPDRKQIPRVTADDLSFINFFYKYAMTGTPVILTGVGTTMVTELWTLKHLQHIAGKCQGTMKKMVPQSVCAGRLEDVRQLTVAEFLDHCGETSNAAQSCLADVYSDDLMERLTIPKYFANDLLQRIEGDLLCRDVRPGLQISPEGFKSCLQTERNGLHTWSALMHGRQRWLVYRRVDVSMLYPGYDDPGTTVQVFSPDLDNPDMKLHPLLSETQPLEGVLGPGDVIFIPAGCPHQTESLDVTASISGRYVDLSNLKMLNQHLEIAALVDTKSAALLHQLTSSKFQMNMKSAMDHTSYKDYKTWPPNDYNMYDLTPEIIAEHTDSVSKANNL